MGKNDNSNVIKESFVATLPVMAGYLVLGMGFGMILKAKGIGIIWAFLMSTFIYAGAMQFVAINLLTGGASFLTVALTTLMVNFRHLFYGISIIEKYKGAGAKKPYLIFTLSDETYSLVVADNKNIREKDKHLYYFCISAMNQMYWIIGSVCGELLGSLVRFNTEGMDFALSALFITIFVEQWRSNRNHLPAVFGVGISIVCVLIFGADKFLIPTMILITAVLFSVRKSEEAKYE